MGRKFPFAQVACGFAMAVHVPHLLRRRWPDLSADARQIGPDQLAGAADVDGEDKDVGRRNPAYPQRLTQ